MNMKRNWLIVLLICAVLTGCTSQSEKETKQTSAQSSKTTALTATEPSFEGYKRIEVDGGDLSGYREPMAVVDIGFGYREYWAFTNEYGQLVRVTAKKIIPQDGRIEPVLSNGRYYKDEANVPGTERADLDKGHVIADSLGGVSNSYNITPQNSTLNRHGDQAYMEKMIRDAGGCTDFEAIITYPDTKTQIPSHYHYTYTLNSNIITEDFDNVDPDEVNKSIPTASPSLTSNMSPSRSSNASPDLSSTAPSNPASEENHDISSIDKNGDHKVSIAEAKAAGFKMPITRDNWLYKYMDDRDGDGMVGE